MFVIPIYDMIILPEVTYYFKQDVFRELNLQEELKEDEEVVFLMLKEDRNRDEMRPEDFFPIGVSGKVEGIDSEGSVSVRTLGRVDVRAIQATPDMMTADVEARSGEQDLDAEEAKLRFDKLRTSMLKFIQRFQWGIWARSYVLHWKNVSEVVSALSAYLNLTNEEKYAILETDSTRERFEKMERSVYEFMEIARVGEEAENDQQERHEKVYREEAIKKQIEFLQRQLDEMHPENVSDVRKFEQKIEESGMNETARKEAEKVLNRMKQEGKDSHEYGMLYDFLDSSKLFKGCAAPDSRSIMNATFVTGDPDLDAKFVKESTAAGFVNLKGHRSVGGMRASIYNAMPPEGVASLVDFMRKFEAENA